MSSEIAILPETSERLSQRNLSRSYKIALITVAVLLIVTQLVVQSALYRQSNDAHIVNLAGRQSMHSQRLCKLALALKYLPVQEQHKINMAEMEKSLNEFELAQMALIFGDKTLGLPGDYSRAIEQMLTDVNKHFRVLINVIRKILDSGGLASDQDISQMLQAEKQFLAGMDGVVAQMDLESKQRVESTERLELTMLILILLVLFLEARYIFRPAIQRIVANYNANLRGRNIIERQIRRQVALSSLSQEALLHIDLAKLFNDTTRTVVDVLQVDSCTIFKFVPGRQLSLVSAYGWNSANQTVNMSPELSQKLNIQRPNVTLTRLARAEIKDALKDSDSPSAGSLSVPISSGGNAYGMLSIHTHDNARVFGIDETEFLHSIANLMGIMLDYRHSRTLLEEKTAKLESIIDTAADGIIALDGNAKILSVNKAVEKMFGCRSQDLIGNSISEWLIAPHDRMRVSGHLARPANMSNSMVTEFIGKRADGASFPIEVAMNRVVLPDTTLCTCIIRDITERKEVEKRVSEFYSMVSHELRTPLTSIRAALGLMEGGLAGSIPAKAGHLVNVARSESDRLIRLINDILDVRKIEAGKLELRKSKTDPKELISSTVEIMTGMANEMGINLKIDIQSSSILLCDQDRIKQVLSNLLSNAFKYSPTGEDITVKFEDVDSGFCRFSVIDCGPGIPDNQLHKLFGKFQQLDSSDSRPKGGTGLGLAISKAIIEQHHGRIGVKTAVGNGSTFWFELPVHVEANNE